MPNSYKTSGETWKVYLGDDRPHPGVVPVIFHCTSNPSHGWKVVEVSEDDYSSEARISELDDSELAALFDRAQPFDFTHDPKAEENSVGDTKLR